MSRVSKRDLIFITHFYLYINQVSWEMSLFKKLEVYLLFIKYHHQYVFSSVCPSYILDSCVWLILFLIFSVHLVIWEPSLATYHYIIQLFYQHGMYDTVLLIYVENWPSTFKFMWLITVNYVHCIGIKNREFTNL